MPEQDRPDNLNWKKSSKTISGDCVEVALTENQEFVWTRNSNDPDGPWVRYTIREWRAFIDGAHEYEFDF